MSEHINFDKCDHPPTDSDKGILALLFDDENVVDENTSLDSPYILFLLLTILLALVLFCTPTRNKIPMILLFLFTECLIYYFLFVKEY